MSKKFEYELMLRLEKAEKAIASLASKIEKDLGGALEKVFKGSSEFDVRSMDAYFTKLRANLQGISQLNADETQREIARREGEQAAEEEASRKRFQQIKNDSQTKNQLAEEEYNREIAQREGERAAAEEANRKHMQSVRERAQLKSEERSREADGLINQMELERQQAEQNSKDRAAKAAEDKKYVDQHKAWVAENAQTATDNADKHIKRLSEVNKMVKSYQDQYKDPAAQQAIQQTSDKLANLSRTLETSGLSIKEQQQLFKEGMKAEQDGLDKIVGKDKKAAADRIANIREVAKADEAAQAIRYEKHQTVLDTIKQARLQNASDLAAIEQRITNMTEAEAKQQLDAYRKTAKARVDYAIEQGYKLEAIEARQSANGARSVSAIFQVQQAIEDSMYAGLRGAGNNIAMLLTSISSGWLAIGGLIGIATLQLASHLGVFDKLNEAMDGALWKTKEQVGYEEYLARLRDESFNRTTKQQIDARNFDPSGKSPEQAQRSLENAKNELSVLQQRENKLRIALGLYEQIQENQVFANVPGASSDSAVGREILAGRERLDDLKKRFAALGIEYRLTEADSKKMQEELENLGSSAAATASDVKVLEDQLNKVREAYARTQEQEALKEAALENIEAQTEASQAVVKSREDELQAIQKAVEASQRALEIEERRADAIRKAASARDDEFAKQKLGLENTILDMEANEKAKAAKDKAGSAEEKIKGQLAWAKQWAEQQAKIDKANNPQNGSNIAAAKDWWINNQEQQAQAALDRIKKTEQAEIEAAKKVAEEAKKANLDAMEVVQKKKVEDLKKAAEQLAGQGRFGEAQDTLDQAQKTLKEIQDAEAANLKQKDSVQQGKEALREIEELHKQLKAIDDEKLAISAKAQEAEKQRMLQQKALEDQAEARLETAKVAHEQLLNIKEMISKTSLIDPSDLDAVAKFRAEMERILALKMQMGSVPALNGAGVPIQGPLPLPGTSGAGSTGPTMPGMPTAPGAQFNMSFSMNNASPNSVAAAANSIVQSQKAMAMLSGV